MHDAEYHILAAQNVEKWDDDAINQRLAALKAVVRNNWYYDVWYRYNQSSDSFLGFNTGFSMDAINDGTTLIAPRIGVGAPDLYVGVDLELQTSCRQSLYATIDSYPNFSFDEHRLNLYAAWELMLDEETGLNLRLAAWDWYNSTSAQGTKPNDLMYMMLVGWTFWLVFGGCGSAALAAGFPDVGIGWGGVSFAFGRRCRPWPTRSAISRAAISIRRFPQVS